MYTVIRTIRSSLNEAKVKLTKEKVEQKTILKKISAKRSQNEENEQKKGTCNGKRILNKKNKTKKEKKAGNRKIKVVRKIKRNGNQIKRQI